MTILREFDVVVLRNRKRRMAICLCDECGVEFERQRCFIRSKLTFCSQGCRRKSRSDGAMWEQNRNTRLERYGTLDHSTAQSRKIASVKRNATIAVRYGVTNAGQIPNGIKKRLTTCQQRYGWQTPFQSSVFLEKAIKRNTSSEIQEKREKTTLERYGVRSMLSLPEVNALGRTPEAEAKRHSTLKRNGFFGNPTKPELALGALLSSQFSKVESTVSPFDNNRRWTLDFWVIDHDCYVQLDGVYWHGLNRPRDVIVASTTSRDKKILEKMYTDDEVDVWFTNNDKRLIRVTDCFVNSNAQWEIRVVEAVLSGHVGVLRLV